MPFSPSLAGRADGAAKAEKDVGELQSSLLGDVAAEVMLRRTNDELARGLPPKRAYVVVAAVTAVQRAVHGAVQGDASAGTFARLTMLRANLLHPKLLLNAEHGSREGSMALRRHVPEMPEHPSTLMTLSGKLQLCARLLDRLLETGERVVVVSSSLSTLAMVGAYVRGLEGRGDAVCSLLGSMTARTRDRVRAAFNSRTSGLRVCLLSVALAEGINLVGASRLVQLDPSWNPAVDAQALGRIHRPGQTKPCYLYRLAAGGTVDETILVRQGGKDSLLKSLRSKKLPAVNTDDRAALFSMDDADVAPRLSPDGGLAREGLAGTLAAAAVDDASVVTHDVGEGAAEDDVGCECLQSVLGEELREAVRVTGDADMPDRVPLVRLVISGTLGRGVTRDQ